MVVKKEIEEPGNVPQPNVVIDESCNFLIYAFFKVYATLLLKRCDLYLYHIFLYICLAFVFFFILVLFLFFF